MAERRFLLFGRGEREFSPEEQRLRKLEEKASSRLEALKSESSATRKELSSMKRELSRSRAVMEKWKSVAEQEEKALKAIRTDVDKKIKSADKKSDQLGELEKKLAQKERDLNKKGANTEKLLRREASIRAGIEALQKDQSNQKAVLAERQREVSRLKSEMSGLLRTKTEAKRLELSVKKLTAKDRQLSQDVAKKEKRVADGSKIISTLEKDAENHKRIIIQLGNNISELRAFKKKSDDELSAKNKALMAVERELADMGRDLKIVLKEEEAAEKKKAALSQHAKHLTKQEFRIEQKKRELEKLHVEAQSIERGRRDITALLEDKKHVLNDLKTSIVENSKVIKELHEHERNARRAAQHLEKAQHENNKKLKILEAKEKEITKKEAVWIEHDHALKAATAALSKDKKELSGVVDSRKAELLLVKQEWDKKMRELKTEKSELQREKADVRRLVESDIFALKDKEDELVKTIKLMDEDRDRLEDEEKSLLRRVALLEKTKAALERQENSLKSKEKKITDGERILSKGLKYVGDEKKKIEAEKDKIYRARKMKQMLPKMEKRYTELRKIIGKLEARAIHTGTRPSASRLLKEHEKELALKERGIELETRKLMDRENEVDALEQRKEKAFNEYLREEVERVKQGRPGREIMHPEIHAMIDDTRERVMQGKIDEAVRSLAQVEILVSRLNSQDQKRLFGYDIRDLKASIKLATLA